MRFQHQQLGIQPETIREYRGSFKGNQEKLRPKKKIGLVSPISGDLFPRELGTIMEISSNKMLPS
jgi:hypothetical protein